MAYQDPNFACFTQRLDPDLQDQLGTHNFQDWVNNVEEPCVEIIFFLGTYPGHLWALSGPARALNFSRVSQHGLCKVASLGPCPRCTSAECLPWADALLASFLTLEYSISIHWHSTFHEICTIHECGHIVQTPKCREISEKWWPSRGLNPGPSSIAEDALTTELLDWADAVAKIS